MVRPLRRATSAEALLSGLAAELGVTGEGPGSVTGRVVAALGTGPAVVVLDNFETPWSADPLPVEELLRAIAAVPQAGLAVSSRGTGRPAGLHWRDFAMISPLPLAEARRVFLAVAGADLAGDPRLDGAWARYEQALPLYRQAGNVVGQANCIKGLGDIDLERSDYDSARACYEQALPLYHAIPDLYAVGWTLVCLARLDSADSERARHWTTARLAWASIGRDDLIESVKAEFE